MELSGLDNTQKVRHAEHLSSPSAAIRHLRNHVACTTAESNGAINVWDDKDGNYRVEVMRYMHTVDSLTTTSLEAVRRYLKEWLPKIERKGE